MVELDRGAWVWVRGSNMLLELNVLLRPWLYSWRVGVHQRGAMGEEMAVPLLCQVNRRVDRRQSVLPLIYRWLSPNRVDHLHVAIVRRELCHDPVSASMSQE